MALRPRLTTGLPLSRTRGSTSSIPRLRKSRVSGSAGFLNRLKQNLVHGREPVKSGAQKFRRLPCPPPSDVPAPAAGRRRIIVARKVQARLDTRRKRVLAFLLTD